MTDTPDYAGSSPLTRGKRHTDRCADWTGGLIPAHAGKTSIRSSRLPISRAHPRSRGENDDDGVATHRRTGSSPLTRGKQGEGGCEEDGCGLIPAHAGKTVGGWEGGVNREAHPRSRGENEALAASDATDKGSSPLTRGKPIGRTRRRS